MSTRNTEGAVKFRKNRKDKRHGTPNGYSNLGCRCDRCTAANTAQHRDYMKDTPEQVKRHRDRERVRYYAKHPDAEPRG